MRHFANPFTGAEDHLDPSGCVSPKFRVKMLAFESAKLVELENRQSDIFDGDYVFTGSAGIALLYYLLAKTRPEQAQQHLLKAASYVQILQHRRPRVTFLCGSAGPLAIGIVVGHRLGPNRPKELPEPAALAQCLEGLWSMAESRHTREILYDEMLYGRAGYLHALLFVNRETGHEYMARSLIEKTIRAIFASGQELAAKLKFETPLMYEWYGSYYLGGAHGHAGILYMLLQAREYVTEQQMKDLVFPTLDWLLTLRFDDGNLPKSLGRKTNKLVQWCHGAPGFVQLCCVANKITGDNKYLDAALACGEVVWQRGLCTKGYSICHGVAGNAYTFLELYQTTKDSKYLQRACCFADWCIEEKSGTEQRAPDAPASLFEGLAGRLYFIADMLDPINAKFPGFTL